MAKACLGKEEDDGVEIVTPEGTKFWTIINIKYANVTDSKEK